ncbi:MAG TPA: hypothetical protein VG097_18770 [Gemmata sp.]|jgi:hypothetical protein|nr:hypothetical protein [Gemmata sp.]
MAKKKPPREEMKPDGEESSLPNAETPVVKAGAKVSQAPKAKKEHVVTPVAEVVEIVKKKRPRFVREKKEQKTQTEATQLTPQSTTMAGKMMSKNIIPLPKEETDHWPKSKRKP